MEQSTIKNTGRRPSNLIGISEFARQNGFSRTTIYNWIRDNRISQVEHGGRLWIDVNTFNFKNQQLLSPILIPCVFIDRNNLSYSAIGLMVSLVLLSNKGIILNKDEIYNSSRDSVYAISMALKELEIENLIDLHNDLEKNDFIVSIEKFKKTYENS